MDAKTANFRIVLGTIVGLIVLFGLAAFHLANQADPNLAQIELCRTFAHISTGGSFSVFGLFAYQKIAQTRQLNRKS